VKKQLLIPILFLLATGGCLRRQMTVTSQPEGALVYMNGQEVGRTPFTKDFIWYGRYEVAIRENGYEPLKTTTRIFPPIYQWIPFDLASDTLPITDRHEISYTLRPASTQPAEKEAVLARARELQGRLESP